MSTLTLPAVILGMDDATYHARSELSSTGVRQILDSPARFQWEQAHRRESVAFDVGHAAHKKILGVGSDIVPIPDEHLTPSGAVSTKVETVAWLAEQRAAGLVPIGPADAARVDAMAEAVLSHPAARLFLERPGHAEASMFAADPTTGVGLRARPDSLPDPTEARTILVDLKTARTADPRQFGREAAAFGYHQQDDFYRRVLTLARGDEDPAFVFVVVEKAPPHLVSVIELDTEARRIAAERNRRAIDIYAECVATDTWPGYPVEVATVPLPRWAEFAHEEEFAS